MTYKQEKIKPYAEEGAKGAQVEKMFDSIAHSYDLLNHALSMGIDKQWRKAAINSLRPYQPQHILDVATGTGDFALLAARELQPKALLGIDISEGMLAVGRKKVAEAGLEKTISFAKEDCLRLSMADDTFDAVMVAYGIRNFEDLDRGLSEMCRVLRPGGRLVIVELTSPVKFPMKQLFWLYSHLLMPAIGRIVSRDASAYTYLPRTMEAFPQGEAMQGILQKAGFSDVKFRRFTFGLSTLYTATKPIEPEDYKKKIFGLVGHPLGHSFSAGFFGEKFKNEEINAEYLNFDLERIELLPGLLQEKSHLCGFNVTIPYKEAVMPFLNDVSATAREIGAVNTVKVVRKQNGELHLTGHNTDIVGFVDSIKPLLQPCHNKALVLGTGGASKAIMKGLEQLGIVGTYVSRQGGEGRLSYEQLSEDILAEHTIIINCTPLGTFPHVAGCPPIPYHLLTKQHLLYDLVYNPAETEFLKKGNAQGCTTKNGLEMLHKQALAAWKIWNTPM